MPAVDPAVRGLTAQQQIAAASKISDLFIEAEPGSGKTTVAAQRYGVLRYLGAHDDRAVLAVSFTRSATAELRTRVRRTWGPSASYWPHRIGTIDFLLRRLVRALLADRHIEWIGDHVEIDVINDWRSVTTVSWGERQARVGLIDRRVVVRWVPARNRKWPTLSDVEEHVGSGTCTHDDIRTVLTDALEVPALAEVLKQHLATTVRSIIVDEVFDANGLDLAVVQLALDAGVAVTIIGDPWQALYGFRGARPDLVPEMVKDRGMRSLPLTASFRWDTDEQRELATNLRAGAGVVLPQGDISDADVALAFKWDTLWSIAPRVLPIAFPPYSDNDEGRAAETLLLNQVTRNAFLLDAAALGESLKVLEIADTDVRRDLEPALNAIVVRLHAGDGADEIHQALSEMLYERLGRPLRNAMVHDDRLRIEALRARVANDDALVPGLTIHQAKGREWDCVAVRLDAGEREALARGLTSERESFRMVYVACTRARRRTFAV
jgi:DNA helicase-2/ATP-dependent DNA helicase PcrA